MSTPRMVENLDANARAVMAGWTFIRLNDRSGLPREKQWTTNPERWMDLDRVFHERCVCAGVLLGESGIIAIDEDGRGALDKMLADLGLELPATFTVQSRRGRHMYFLLPAGVARAELSAGGKPWKANHPNVEVWTNGHFLRAPGSTLRQRDAVTNTVIDSRPPVEAPAWLVNAVRKKAGTGSGTGLVSQDAEGDVARVLAALGAGDDPCQALSRVDVSDGDRPSVLTAQLRIVRLAEQGHQGGTRVLDTLRESFLDAPHEHEAEKWWYQAVTNAAQLVVTDGITPEKDRGCCGGGLTDEEMRNWWASQESWWASIADLIPAATSGDQEEEDVEDTPETPVVDRREVLPAPGNPLRVARHITPDRAYDGMLTLRRWRGAWWCWQRTHWAEVEDATARKWVYERTEHASYLNKDDVKVSWAPTAAKVTGVLDAYGAAVALLPAVTEHGTLISTNERPRGFVATPAGLLNVANRTVDRHTPDYFNAWCLPFDYEPAAAEPSEWLGFLKSVWPEDPDTITMLQEWLGYLVSGRTDQQKAMLLVGPKRSGKGTILRVATNLVGAVNTAAPALQALTERFGLQDCIGKALIAVGDARLSGQGTGALVQNMLSIIGEDSIQVDRKYRDPWVGRMTGRMMIASNEVPDFRDASGAIGSRFLIGRMTNTFYGVEDLDLEAKLVAELPGILVWALDGLDRLAGRGRFTESTAALEAREEMEESESPAQQFLHAVCIVGHGHTVAKEQLYEAWSLWTARNGYASGSIATFARQLRAAEPTITSARARAHRGREYVFNGVAFADPMGVVRVNP